MVVGVLDGLEVIEANSETMDYILTVYGLTRHAENLQHGGLSSKVAGNLLKSAGPILSAIDLTSEVAETSIAMVVNRAINLDDAYATLDILDDLPIDQDYTNQESEWVQGIELARQDLDDLATEEKWREFAFAAKENSRDLLTSGVGFTVSTVAASGLTVKGIALGSAAHAIAPFLLILPVALTVDAAGETVGAQFIGGSSIRGVVPRGR